MKWYYLGYNYDPHGAELDIGHYFAEFNMKLRLHVTHNTNWYKCSNPSLQLFSPLLVIDKPMSYQHLLLFNGMFI
mgnify:CR=1 FL=1